MEPLNDRELNQILQEWRPPATPSSLGRIPPRMPWWRWLLVGTIRIPVPVGVAMLAGMALLLFFMASGRKQPALSESQRQVSLKPVRVVSLADFQPVNQLQPRIIGRANEGN